MSHYYNLPKRDVIDKAHILRIEDEHELKYACQEKSFASIRLLNMKNTKVNDNSTLCLTFLDSTLNLHFIDLSENFSFITDATIQNLCNCKGLTNLKTLNLADNDISDLAVEMMGSHSNFQHLQQLILYGNSSITWVSLLSLGKSEWIRGLKKLDLHATSVADKGLAEYLESQNSSSLEDLDISMSWKRVSDLTLFSLSVSEFCRNIKKLNLEDCSVSDQGIEQLCRSPNCAQLQSLNVSNSIEKSTNRITDKSLEALAFSKTVCNLKTLYLKATGVTSLGVKMIASSPIIEKLQTLKVSHCKAISDQSLYSLGAMIQYSNLQKLHVNATSITKAEGARFEEMYPKVMIIY